MEPIEASGKFWIATTPDRAADGQLTWQPGSKARLILDRRVIDQVATPIEHANGSTSITSLGDPYKIVEDGTPRVLHGDTDRGPVTCVDSYLGPPDSGSVVAAFGQSWGVQTLIVGAHLSGHATVLDAVRFVLDTPGWWSHLADGETASAGAGELTCSRDNDELVTFEFRPASPLTVRSADRTLRSVQTLAKLATGAELTPLRVSVRAAGSAEWLTVLTRDQDPSETSWPSPDDLLPPTWLTLQRLADWLALEERMDGLAAAVAFPPENVAVQVSALVSGSLIEGIHKRLVSDTSTNYVDRARALYARAIALVPELTGSVRADWAELVKKARHDLAHHNTGRPFEKMFWDWLIAETTTMWVLRVCLLAELGLDAAEMQAAVDDHQRYGFYRANLEAHIRERDALPPTP